MAITFTIGSAPEEALLFEPELRDYFRRVSADGGIAAGELTDLDPYGDALFEGERLSRLERQADALLSKLEELYRRAVLPSALEPPEKIGLETEPDGKPCGRAGALQFLNALRGFCREARSSGRSLLAIGD